MLKRKHMPMQPHTRTTNTKKVSLAIYHELTSMFSEVIGHKRQPHKMLMLEDICLLSFTELVSQ